MPHIHDKIDWTVDVFVVNGDAVLLRKHDKYKMWLAPGGHIELDEDPTVAALREVQEETGLTVTLIGNPASVNEGEGYKELLPPVFLNMYPINETHSHISLIYFARSDSRDVSQGEEEVSDEMRWFTKEELDDPSLNLKETIKHYAQAALAVAS